MTTIQDAAGYVLLNGLQHAKGSIEMIPVGSSGDDVMIVRSTQGGLVLGLTPYSDFTLLPGNTTFGSRALLLAWADSHLYQVSGGTEHFKGVYASSAALTAAVPAAEAGDYAYVDAGTGTDTTQYLWDDDDGAWIQGATGSFTEGNVRSTPLTGFAESTIDDSGDFDPDLTGNKVSASDTILQALQKLWMFIKYLLWKIGFFPNYYNVKFYGAKGDGIIVTDGNMAQGAFLVGSPSGGFTNAKVGQILKIRGAGPNGSNHVGVILEKLANDTVRLDTAAVNAVASGGRVLYGTEDNAAVQAAWTAAHIRGGGKVHVPNGVYCFRGNLVTSDNNGYNPYSLLFAPSANMISGAGAPGTYTATWLEGETPTASFEGPLVESYFDQVHSGAIFESFLRVYDVAEAAAGTMSASTGSAVITGTGTNFTTVRSSGPFSGIPVIGTDSAIFTAAGVYLGQVATVDSATQVTLKANALATVSGAAFKIYVDGLYPSMIGTKGLFNGFSSTNLSDIYIRNIYTRTDHHPILGKWMSGQMLRFAGNTNIAECFDGADVSALNLVAPKLRSVGFAPTQSNQGTMVIIHNCISVGNWLGFTYGEHTYTDDCQALCCWIGHDWQEAGHSSYGSKMMSHWCKYNTSFGNFYTGYGTGQHIVNVSNFIIESIGGGHWFDITADVYDPANGIRGNWFFSKSQSGVGPTFTLVKTGGTRLYEHHMVEYIVTDANSGAAVKSLVQGLAGLRLGGSATATGPGMPIAGGELVLSMLSDTPSLDGASNTSTIQIGAIQTIADGVIGRIIFPNAAIGAGEKRNVSLDVIADGALNTGKMFVNLLNAGALQTCVAFQKDGMFVANTAAPATPAGGGMLYVESGSLKFKGSSGTVTVLGVA